MTDPLTTALTKLFDYAHLGKLATDFAPGLLISTVLLFGTSVFTDLAVLPYFERSTYDRALKDANDEVTRLEESLAKIRAELKTARMRGETETGTEKLAQAKLAAHLIEDETALKAKLTTARAEADARRKARADAGTLSYNLDLVKNHVGKLILLSFIFGVILAQASGGFFYNNSFHKHLQKHWPGVFKELYPKESTEEGHYTETYYRGLIRDKAFLDRLPNINEYYRYLEVAMNMILPVFALAAVFYAIFFVAGDWGNLALAFAATVVGVGVYRNARDQYVGYFIRKTDRMACLRKKLAEEETARAASI